MQKRIHGYTFQLTEPFQPGTVITKAEAQALNDLRAENIQNNFRKYVAEEVQKLSYGELLSVEVLQALQTKLSTYDHEYTFVEKGKTRPRIGDIELECRLVARERAEGTALLQGREPTEAEYEKIVDETCKLPSVLEEARNRVAAKRRAASEGLADL